MLREPSTSSLQRNEQHQMGDDRNSARIMRGPRQVTSEPWAWEIPIVTRVLPWALRDSNPRLLPCKGNLIAPGSRANAAIGEADRLFRY